MLFMSPAFDERRDLDEAMTGLFAVIFVGDVGACPFTDTGES